MRRWAAADVRPSQMQSPSPQPSAYSLSNVMILQGSCRENVLSTARSAAGQLKDESETRRSLDREQCRTSNGVKPEAQTATVPHEVLITLSMHTLRSSR